MQEENKKNEKSKIAEREEKVLEFWRENDVFQKTMHKKDNPKGEFVFFEGPPTANGKPGIHHLEARSFKDAIPRYKTMRGYHVARKGGWDTHGLPVELQVEKKLGLNSKKAIEEYGIAQFNKECKESVGEYLDVWNKFTKRIGYWVDQDNSYFTYDNNYIESVWNIFSKIDEKGLLYKDYRIVPWCARCGTALSSHELAQGYMDVKDLSVTAKFKIIGEENTYILAWTTTPWTLPGNVALAVGEDIDYVKIKVEEDIFIVAKELVTKLFTEYEIIGEVKGKDLVGLSYEPLYPYLKDNLPEDQKEKLEKAFKVYGADFVTTTDGTGVVHTAVMYGQDDFELGTKLGLPKFHTVGLDGNFIQGTFFLEGRFVKDEDVAVDIIKDLAHRGLLFKKERYEHSYPHCWRCKTPLIYYARDSWYIRMSSLRDKLLSENQKINWEPNHIRDGRFGEWLHDVKDWAVSRERYWGTPLPVWVNEENKSRLVIKSLDDLKTKTKKSGNKYFLMRHGQTQHNILGVVSCAKNSGDHLTDDGKKMVVHNAENLKGQKIDIIFSSPFVRTTETAELVAFTIGFDKSSIVYDDRLHEFSLPMYEGRTWREYHETYPKNEENFATSPEGNESYMDIKNRVMSFLYEIEDKYKDKNILIITHGAPAWLMVAGTRGYNAKDSLALITEKKDFHYLENSDIIELPFVPLPHNENYELDFHRPYIDDIKIVENGFEYKRVNEVMDCWFDSGCMPFAQDHYPFENKEKIDNIGYPADYISEAIDQTRGWFYTLHAIGVLMERGLAYKNVICLGHILDANGKKMSKSLGNIVDPSTMIDKYGVDTLRLWMYSVNAPGESKNFDEKTVGELHNKVFTILYNIFTFYELYRDITIEKQTYENSNNILDKWILSRMHNMIASMTTSLDNYKLLEPVREIRSFIDDLSTWYLRRSRERLKEGDEDAKKTLYFVLKTLTQILAPFAPFAAEDIWQKLKKDDDVESVHLTNWPTIESDMKDEQVINDMEIARSIVTLGLEARQKANIKVRQPLSALRIKSYTLSSSYTEIIKDELNIKEILVDTNLNDEVKIDTHITESLHKEGVYREFVRVLQDLRKEMGLQASDIVFLTLETNINGQELVASFKNELQKTVGIREIKIMECDGVDIKIEEFEFKIKIEKL